MLMDSLRSAFRTVFGASLVVIAFLAFAEFDESPGLSYDKANHLLAFLVLAGLAELAWPAPALVGLRLAGLVLFGLAIELVQAALPYREASGWDLLADLLGLALYLILRRLIRPLASRLFG